MRLIVPRVRGEGNAQSYLAGEGPMVPPELVGCVSCALCTILKLRVTSARLCLTDGSGDTRSVSRHAR
eukprot:3583466-Prymnesium_polylepis.1